MTEDQEAPKTVKVRRQWNDWQIATYRLNDVSGLHWSGMSGGVQSIAPRDFIHGYVWCTGMIDGELAHSCRHGPGPHHIKVCITKKGNEGIWAEVRARAADKGRPPE
jgi:hypothetical protein